jgi:hypothetical protein
MSSTELSNMCPHCLTTALFSIPFIPVAYKLIRAQIKSLARR